MDMSPVEIDHFTRAGLSDLNAMRNVRRLGLSGYEYAECVRFRISDTAEMLLVKSVLGSHVSWASSYDAYRRIGIRELEKMRALYDEGLRSDVMYPYFTFGASIEETRSLTIAGISAQLYKAFLVNDCTNTGVMADAMDHIGDAARSYDFVLLDVLYQANRSGWSCRGKSGQDIASDLRSAFDKAVKVVNTRTPTFTSPKAAWEWEADFGG